jgi:hypothetical protein
MSMSKSKNDSVSPAQKILNAVWPYISGRRGLIFAAIGVAAAGVAMNWGWLVAMGAAPILLAVLPCAVMCGLGLCMNMGKGKSCATDAEAPPEERNFRDGPEDGT